MPSVPFVAPELYPWFIGGVAVLLVLFVFLAYRTVKHLTSPNKSQTDEVVTTARAIPTIHPEVSALMRHAFETNEERTYLVDLASAMVGFGPTASHGEIRKVAETVMGQQVYIIFFRTFTTVFQLPGRVQFSNSTVFDLSTYPAEQLLNDESVLTFLVTYAKCIHSFYLQISADQRVTQHLPGFIVMSGLLDKLIAVHDKFYVV